MNDNELEFLTIIQFAKKLCVHPNTIRRAIKSGHISAFKVGSGKRASYRIARSETNRLSLCDLEKIIEKIINERASVQKTT